MSRLADAFARLRAERRGGLITYTTAGDPDLPRSAEILKALDRAGADVLEVGIPFSDPLADGPVIQRAAELGRGFLYGISRLGVTGARATVAAGAGALVARIRTQTSMPIALGFGISRPEHVAEVTTYAD